MLAFYDENCPSLKWSFRCFEFYMFCKFSFLNVIALQLGPNSVNRVILFIQEADLVI